jgi:poly(A) polymerase
MPDAGVTRITGAWIAAPATQAVFDALEAGGYRAFFVGGCVRNALLGQPVSDIDISTDAVPQEVMRLADVAGLRPVPTGIDHGTVTVVSGGEGHEVTTFRRDVETDGRRAVVAFSTDMRDDARRRDFTINALYADRSGAVIDPLGQGLVDLAAPRIRFIEDAEARIREDYLRILRFFRFHAWYGHPEDGMDPEALAAIGANSAGIGSLSRERMGHEMLRLLSARDPAPSLGAMQATGVLARVLAGADARLVAPLVHAEGFLGAPPDPIRRLAALGGEAAGAALKLSKADDRRLALLRDAAGGMAGPGELGYRHGAEAAADVVILRAVLAGTLPDPAQIDAARHGAAARFPVRAADLMDGLSGPALGRRLAELEAAWIASGFTATRDDLLGRN